MEEDEIVEVSGDIAIQLAKLLKLPFKAPTFSFTVEGEQAWVGYSAGFDYDKDGYTFEDEWTMNFTIKDGQGLSDFGWERSKKTNKSI